MIIGVRAITTTVDTNVTLALRNERREHVRVMSNKQYQKVVVASYMQSASETILTVIF